MPLTTISYGALAFPCSRYGLRKLDYDGNARLLLEKCDIADISQMRRPPNAKIRYLWMSRFVQDMHWLPLIEVLIGCDRETSPRENQAFLSALEHVNPVRVCHRPWGAREAGAWGIHLRDHIKQVCPDPRVHELVRKRTSEIRNGGDVFFISSECEEAATQSRKTEQTWLINSWTHYRHTRIGRCELTEDERRAFLLGSLDSSDLAAKAYQMCLTADAHQ